MVALTPTFWALVLTIAANLLGSSAGLRVQLVQHPRIDGLERLSGDVSDEDEAEAAPPQVQPTAHEAHEAQSAKKHHKKKGHKKKHNFSHVHPLARHESTDPMAALHSEVAGSQSGTTTATTATTANNTVIPSEVEVHHPAEESPGSGLSDLMNGISDFAGTDHTESQESHATTKKERKHAKKQWAWQKHKKKHHHKMLNITKMTRRNMTDPIEEIHEEVAHQTSTASPSIVSNVTGNKHGLFKLLPDCTSSGNSSNGSNCTRVGHKHHGHKRKKLHKKRVAHNKSSAFPPTPPPWDVTLMKHAEAHINNAVSAEPAKVAPVSTTTAPSSLLPDPADSEEELDDDDQVDDVDDVDVDA